MAQQTAMMQLLAQLKDERQKLPMHIEWDRCYQAIEMVIENNYLQMEKEQIEEAYLNGCFRVTPYGYYNDSAEQYYKETYGKEMQ